MNSCRVIIPYKPKPKASVRLGKYGAYNPTCKGMIETREYVRQQLADKRTVGKPLLTGPLLVILHFRLPVASFLTAKKRLGRHDLPHTRKPDGDNLEKFINDALTGIIWDDDAQIVWMLRSKTYTADKRGQTVLYVTEIDDAPADYEMLLNEINENIYANDYDDITFKSA